MKKILPKLLASVLCSLVVLTPTARAQSTAFTYQGRLNVGANPANGLYDLHFRLHDLATGGNQWGPALTNSAVAVSNGLFTTTLDFGFGVFTGGPRWLQIAVRTNGGGGFEFLSPRTALLPAPYAIYAANAAQAETVSGTVPASGLNGLYSNPVNFNHPANSFSGNGTGLANVNALTLGGLSSSNFWKLAGNDVAPGQFLGSTNNQAVELRVGGARALRLEPHGAGSPGLIGGFLQNSGGGFVGGAIAGGGTSGSANQLLGDYAFIGAGHGGQAGHFGAVVGGAYNSALEQFAFVGTGQRNTNLGLFAGIVAGTNNLVGPGADNAFVGGGAGNRALGVFSIIPGGLLNSATNFAFAAGRRAKANHTGAFVWADATDADFASSSNNQFLIRAAGNVGINRTNPAAALHVNGGVRARGGAPGAFGVNNNGYAFSGNGDGDEDGGMFSSANGQLEFYGNALERMRITDTGNVGIGTNNPQSALHVNGTVTATGFSGSGAGLTNVNALTLGGLSSSNFWKPTGNAGTTPGTHFVGTTDTNALEFKVNNQRALRLEPNSFGAPNVIGGSPINFAGAGVVGATIAGGGGGPSSYSNKVLAAWGTVGGGSDNTSSGVTATVGGGQGNTSSGLGSTVGGGSANSSSGGYATVPGGDNNLAAGDYSFAAGRRAKANHQGSFVWADSQFADFASTATRQFLIRAEGGVGINKPNPATALDVNGTVTATGFNGIAGTTLTLGTTDTNALEFKVNGTRALRLEPTANDANHSGIVNVVGGSPVNFVGANVYGATIAGGGASNYFGPAYTNRVEAHFGTVSGGIQNTIQTEAFNATIGGGVFNTIQTFASDATIGGGSENGIQAQAFNATIGGGRLNTNSGPYATIPGGVQNHAAESAFAAGTRAKANHTGAFVWADSTFADFASTAANQFLIRASGGVGIGTAAPGQLLQVGDQNLAAGSQGMMRFGSHSATEAYSRYWDIGVPKDDQDISGRYYSFVIDDPQWNGTVPEFVIRWGSGNVGIGIENPTEKLHVIGNILASGTICAFNVLCPSDRNVKAGFEPVDTKAILEKVAALAITRWHYTNDTATPHLGAVAQDFHAAFAVGPDDKHISTVDADGVALAAIQGLNQKVEERSQDSGFRIQKLNDKLNHRDTEITELQQRNEALENRLEKLERLMNRQNGGAR